MALLHDNFGNFTNFLICVKEEIPQYIDVDFCCSV